MHSGVGGADLCHAECQDDPVLLQFLSQCVWGWLDLCGVMHWLCNHNPSGGLCSSVEEEG